MTDFAVPLIERMQARFGAQSSERFSAWSQALRSVGGNERQRLAAVNALANRAPWSSDDLTWGQTDYWATPGEFIARQTGDCEDYVIAKYFSLLALGVDPASLRLTYVRAFMDGQLTPHMVLAWYAQPDAEPLLLDNLDPRLLSASQRPDLSPLFSIAGSAAMPVREGGRARQISDVTLSRWEALQKRVALERD
ncbi:MAG: transglutaminase-like cysteine peptidase [Rhodocyclaceae bacterium]